jgi:phosphoribosylaminoimidazolecarboxamide formyltransferase/IMP cyclohydrolase
VVVDPGDYPRLLAALDETPSLAFRFELMRKALAHTAAYDTAIAATLETVRVEGDHFDRGGGEGMSNGTAKAVPDENGTATSGPDENGTAKAGAYGNARVDLALVKIRDLRYGENPHQKAAWYVGHRFSGAGAGGCGLGEATILQGRELSYTNLLDLDAAARIALEFAEPAAVVVKHTNPCGAATGDSAAQAYIRARDADSLAAFGGIVALNRPIDVATAEAIVSTFIEAVIAPAVDTAARDVLARKTNMRVVTADVTPFKSGGVDLRSILGATLLQERDVVAEARHSWSAASLPEGLRVVTKRQPTDDEWAALRFAWRVCAHVKSNSVIFTDARRTLAIGAGQMSRVDAVNVAVMKAQGAGRSLAGSVAASDAFFPFRDGLDAVARAGARAVVQPGGSVRDAEVIAAADEHGLAMVSTGRRHFRH